MAIKESGGPVAIMLFQDGTIRPMKIRTIAGRIWRTKFGDFQINLDYRYIYGKASVYFYYVKCPNPLDVFALGRIWTFLQQVNSPVLRKEDLQALITVSPEAGVGEQTKVPLGQILGFDVLKFLNLLQFTDAEALDHIYDVPLRNEKPLPLSGEVMGFPEMAPKNMGFYVRKDKRIERISLRVKRDGAKVTGYWGRGKEQVEFDLSDRTRRYTSGKSSVYILLEGEKEPVNLNVTSYLGEFVPYEPIWVNDDEGNLSHTHNMFKLATRPPPKKTMNVMLVLIGVIGFILVYQSVINPTISKWQTDEAAKQEKADAAKAAAAHPQSGNGTSPTVEIKPLPKGQPGTPLLTEK